MHLVDVIKHKESGVKYVIAAGDPLPSDAYIRLRTNISPDEAEQYVPSSRLVIKSDVKRKC